MMPDCSERMLLRSLAKPIKFIKDNKAKMFWLWISYQAIKGSLTLSFIWIPLFMLWKKNGGSDGDAGLWAMFAASNIIFILVHIVFMRPKIRTPMERLLSKSGFIVFFSLLSFGLFVWVVFEAVHAPQVLIWSALPWHHWIAVVLVGLAVLLIAFGWKISNPFSILGNGKAFNEDEPGLLAVTRHPLLMGIAFWGAGHFIANGELAFLIFFGLQFVFAVLGAIMLDRKARLVSGPDRWLVLSANTTFLPNPCAIPKALKGMTASSVILRLGLAMVVYIGLTLAHPFVIGVSPFGIL
jgi:uncharacterized membrane protein